MVETEKKENKRVYGVDIIKIIAIASVICLHFTEYYFEPCDNMIFYILTNSFRWFVFGCIGYFIISTGFLNYHKVPRKEYYLKIVQIIIVFFVYCIATHLIISPYNCERPFWEYINEGLVYYFWQQNSYFWYMKFYIAFFCIIPFLNILTNNISSKQHLLLIFLLILFVSMPNFIAVLGDYFPGLRVSGVSIPSYFSADNFPFIYYFIGSYVRKYHRRWKFNKIIIGICVILLILLSHSVLDWIYLHKYQGFFEIGQRVYSFNTYGNVFTLITSTIFFCVILNCEIKSSIIKKVISFISSCTLEMYLGLIIANKMVSIICENKIILKENFLSFIVWFSIEFGVAIAGAIAIKSLKRIFKEIWTFCEKMLIKTTSDC